VKPLRKLILLALAACTATAWAGSREPHIGYLFPAGGQQGTTFEVTVGGQFLRGANALYVSGDGVRASIIKHYRPSRNLQKEQRENLVRQLWELREKRLAELPEKDRARIGAFPGVRPPRKNTSKPKAPPKKAPPKKEAPKKPPAKNNAAKEGGPKKDLSKLPEHPLLRNLEKKSLRELLAVANEFFNYKAFQKKQLNSQLAEMVIVEVTIDPDATPGDRELRLGTPFGLTNPMCFQVGTLPEAREQEPNDPGASNPLPEPPPLDLPVLLNGQIMPGDVDRVRFRAKQGQQLVIETYARHLVPFLADAVPGWFQAVVALYDARGKEVAYADDWRFDPDPVLFCKVPATGEYVLEVRDAIYRGREDFVYRIAIGELPFITRAFPLGGTAGAKTVVAIDGWNLPKKRLPLDTRPGTDPIRHAVLRRGRRPSNEVTYAVDTLPDCTETEPNDDAKTAQRIELPRIVNGRIAAPGDVDIFAFEGRAGDTIVAEVQARRLRSPLDSLLRLTDAAGRVLAWNDDHMVKEGHLHPDMGFLTHHADSYLTARLPADGLYHVRVADAQHHGGDAYGYRLRVSPPQPDFVLLATPSSLTVPGGCAALLTVHRRPRRLRAQRRLDPPWPPPRPHDPLGAPEAARPAGRPPTRRPHQRRREDRPPARRALRRRHAGISLAPPRAVTAAHGRRHEASVERLPRQARGPRPHQDPGGRHGPREAQEQQAPQRPDRTLPRRAARGHQRLRRQDRCRRPDVPAQSRRQGRQGRARRQPHHRGIRRVRRPGQGQAHRQEAPHLPRHSPRHPLRRRQALISWFRPIRLRSGQAPGGPSPPAIDVFRSRSGGTFLEENRFPQTPSKDLSVGGTV